MKAVDSRHICRWTSSPVPLDDRDRGQPRDQRKIVAGRQPRSGQGRAPHAQPPEHGQPRHLQTHHETFSTQGAEQPGIQRNEPDSDPDQNDCRQHRPPIQRCDRWAFEPNAE